MRDKKENVKHVKKLYSLLISFYQNLEFNNYVKKIKIILIKYLYQKLRKAPIYKKFNKK